MIIKCEKGSQIKHLDFFFRKKKLLKKSELKNQENKTKVPACPPL